MEQEGDSGWQRPSGQCSQENAASEVRRRALAVIEEGLESSSTDFKKNYDDPRTRPTLVHTNFATDIDHSACLTVASLLQTCGDNF